MKIHRKSGMYTKNGGNIDWNVVGSREVAGSLTNAMSDGFGHRSQVPSH